MVVQNSQLLNKNHLQFNSYYQPIEKTSSFHRKWCETGTNDHFSSFWPVVPISYIPDESFQPGSGFATPTLFWWWWGLFFRFVQSWVSWPRSEAPLDGEIYPVSLRLRCLNNLWKHNIQLLFQYNSDQLEFSLNAWNVIIHHDNPNCYS